MRSVKVNIDENEYELVYSFDAIAEAEEILDRPLVTGLRRRDIATPTVNLVRAMLYACAKVKHPTLTHEKVCAMVTRHNLAGIWGKVLDAWTKAQPDPEQGADPQKGQS
jgi:hypothetical protein